MIRTFARAAAVGILGALAGSAWLALAYGRSPELRIDFSVTPPSSIVRGVYPAEREPETGRTFAWTGETMTLDLRDVDRQVDWRLTLRVRGARAGGAANPELEFYVDGVRMSAHPTTVDYEDVSVVIPKRPGANGLTVAIHASSTFVPGPGDPRALGVMLDELMIEPDEIVLPPQAAMTGVALASAAAGIMVALLGVTAGSAVGGTLLLSAAFAALAARGFAPFTDYAGIVARTTTLVGAGTLVLAWVARTVTGHGFRNTAKFAIAFTAAACMLELLTLLHPDMPIGDALFHAHRFQDVAGGRLYFTSIAPGNYSFPYAPGLYVVALPFSGLVPRGNADMTLLRSVVCVADALAGLLLYPLAVRIRGDRLAGALAVALYQLIPLGFGVVAAANLTNAFAQALSVAALAMMASPSLRLERRGMLALLALTLTAASLSHTSTFAIVSVAGIAIGVVFWLRGGPALRSPAAAVVLATVVSVLLAAVIYYGHFGETYRSELTRIGSETAAAAPDAGGRGILDRLVTVPLYLRGYFGIPTLVLAVWGAGLLWHRGARDRGTLAVLGWATACAMFLMLGVLTPVDMRYYLAAIPAVAVVSAAGAAIAWSSGAVSRGTAAALLGWAALTGIRAWWSTLG